MADNLNLVSQPPLNSALIDKGGKISKPWSIWMRDIYTRIAYKGGNAIDDNAALIDSTILTLADAIAQILINITNITQNVTDISKNSDDIAVNVLGISQNVTDIGINATAISDHEALTTAHGSNGDIVGFNDTATELVVGLVNMMGLVSNAVNAAASSVSVTSPNATTAPATYNQVQVETIVTLANETKGDVNQLVTDVNSVVTSMNAVVTQLNDLISNSKTAGQMNTV